MNNDNFDMAVQKTDDGDYSDGVCSRLKPRLSIVVPCYNEEEVLPITNKLFSDKLNDLISSGKISEDSHIIYVNDGSADSTWSIITKLASDNKFIKGVCLSRNYGHQSALIAGLMESKEMGDISVSIDCDGQDDINAIDEMIEEYKNGAEVVYGIRNNRDTDTFFKRYTAETFYKLMNWLGAEVYYNHADYRLVSSVVLNEFKNFQEVNVFLRGLFPLIGFKSACVYYKRIERIAGSTHYPFSKMLGLAFDGITSLSIKPIRFIETLGVIVSFISLVGILYSLVSYLCNDTVHGWASLICLICFFNGIQFICLGIVGEYVGKTYLETKSRPRYVISKRTDS